MKWPAATSSCAIKTFAKQDRISRRIFQLMMASGGAHLWSWLGSR